MSITYIGIAVAILSKVLEMGGVNLGTEAITEFITTGGVIVGGFIGFYGRWRKGDLNIFGGRK